MRLLNLVTRGRGWDYVKGTSQTLACLIFL